MQPSPPIFCLLSLHDALPIFPHSALAPSGQPVWTDMAVRSARAVVHLEERELSLNKILTPASLRNAMVVHAAFSGRSEEHTSELQSPCNLVCHLLLE